MPAKHWYRNSQEYLEIWLELLALEEFSQKSLKESLQLKNIQIFITSCDFGYI